VNLVSRIDTILQSLASPATVDLQAISSLLVDLKPLADGTASATLQGSDAAELEALAMVKESIRQKLLGKVRLTYAESDYKTSLEAALADSALPMKALLGHQEKIEYDFKQKFLKQPETLNLSTKNFIDVSQYRIGAKP
jgi:hypothetical protein